MAESITQEALIITGMAGATAGTRFVGGTSSGAPTIGSFLVGDFAVDQTGGMWICTASGSPGTWVRSGIYGNPAGLMSSTSNSFANSTQTTITGFSSSFLKGGVTFSSGGNSLIVPVTGIYSISSEIFLNPSGGGAARMILYTNKNGSTINQTEMSNPSLYSYPCIPVTFLYSCTAGDALTLQFYQNSGSTWTGGGILGVTLVSQ